MDSGSTEYVDSTGVITSVARDLCAVSVNLDETPEPIFFGRRALYLWGIQCEEDMSNLLDNEVEVNVCCRFPQSQQDKPYVVAVWIGDKPDIKISNEQFVSVYDQTGHVDQISDGSFTIRSDSLPSLVIAGKEVLYRDGGLAGVDWPLVVGDRLMFDASPLEFAHVSGATHRATCAWTGKEPRLVDRFGLSAAAVEQNFDVLTRNRVDGIVVVIPNDVIAFVEVEDAGERIWLFRDSFSQDVERMRDAVKVGDRLCMRLCFAYLFGGCRQWYAAQAWKKGEEDVMAENEGKTMPHRSESLSSNEHTGGRKKAAIEAPSQPRDGSGELASVKYVPCDVLYSDPPLEGSFSSVSKNRALILYKDAWIRVKKQSVYLDGTLVKLSEFRASLDKNGGLNVNFEAVATRTRIIKEKKVSYETTLTWIGEKPSLFAVASPKCASSCASSLLGKRGYSASKEATWFGRVRALYLPNTAIISIDKMKNSCAYVHVSSFLADSENPCDNFISDFVKLGWLLSFNVTHDPMLSNILRAVNIRLVSPGLGRSFDPTNFKSLREELEKLPYHECTAFQSEANNDPASANASRTLFSRPPLQGKITSKGKAVERGTGNISFEALNVRVNVSSVYVGGQLCSKKQFHGLVSSKVVVNFEAVPHLSKKCKMEFTHYATCVWIGDKPSLAAVATSLCEPERELYLNEHRPYIGIVKELYLPDVALLMTEFGTSKSVVCLHLSEFGCESGESADPENFISDFVKLGGLFEFKIRKNDQCPLGLCVYDLGNSTKPTSDVFCSEDRFGLLKVISPDNIDVNTERPCKAVPFYPVYSLDNRSMVLNCVGYIELKPGMKNVTVKHMFGSSTVDASLVVKGPNGDALVDENGLREWSGCSVRFDAELVATPAGGELHVKKVWPADSEDIFAFQIIAEQSVDLDPNTLHRGVISSTDLHVAAIANVNGISILVTLDSIVVLEKCGPSISSVDTCFSVGDHVVLEVKKIRTEMGCYFKAKSCYKAMNCDKKKRNQSSPESEPQVTRTNEVSWRSIWGTGDFSRKATVWKGDNSYFVNYAPSQHPDTLVSLDVSEAARSGRLFEDGKPRKKEKSLKKLENREISFHVARRVSGNEVEHTENLYIASAWVGDYPDIPILIPQQVAAFVRLLCRQWCYEGIIKHFPLPTHAVCNVGTLSVLLPLEDNKKKSHLKIGDKVVLQVKEQFIAKQTILVATFASTKNIFDYCEVLKVVRGKIIDLPHPKGKIKLDGAPVEVWFDLSSVLAINGVKKMNKAIFPWSSLFDKSVSVGTEVYFSAAKDLSLKNKPYRAYEVWVGTTLPDETFVLDPFHCKY